MKKIISLMMALAMVLSITVFALAAHASTEGVYDRGETCEAIDMTEAQLVDIMNESIQIGWDQNERQNAGTAFCRGKRSASA